MDESKRAALVERARLIHKEGQRRDGVFARKRRPPHVTHATVAILRHRAAMYERQGVTGAADHLHAAANDLEDMAEAVLLLARATGTT